ncbi:MAG: hypothetical protein KGJ78_06935 [Alphaproteobacteria bacterium]|nr:hypothetical protein [Alphaproteobacteria bacterium]
MKKIPELAIAWQKGQCAGSRSMGACAGVPSMAWTTGADPAGKAAKWKCVCVMKDCSVNDSNNTQATTRHAAFLRRR